MSELHRLAVLDDYQNIAESMADWDALRARGVEVHFFHEHLGRGPAVAAALKGFDAVAAMRERTVFDAAVIEALPRLRVLVTTGMGNASIDVDALRAHGVALLGTELTPHGTPELTWALMLAALRHLPEEADAVRTGGWQRTVGREAAGLHLGIVGLGNIGTRVAGYGHAFGMKVHAWSPHLTQARAGAAGAELAPGLEELCRDCDVITIHMKLAPSTRGLVGERHLRAIGPAGLLINTSRAGLVDTGALLRGLNEGWLGAAALDVHDTEPLPPDAPIRTAPRTVLTPHIGYVTQQDYALCYRQTVADLMADLDGRELRRLA